VKLRLCKERAEAGRRERERERERERWVASGSEENESETYSIFNLAGWLATEGTFAERPAEVFSDF